MTESSLSFALLNMLLGNIWALLLVAGAGICLLGAKFRLSAFAFLAALGVFGLSMSGFSSADKHLTDSDTAKTISVLSVSVRSSNPHVDTLLHAVLKGGYDIIALQELRDQKLLTEILRQYPEYQGYFKHGKSTVILSRFAAVEHTHIKNVQRVIVQIDEHTRLALYNLHAPKFSKNLAQYNMFFAGLLSDVEASQQSNILIIGDFNSTQHNYWRTKLPGLGFSSALHDSGRGWLGTFPTKNRRYGMLFPFLSIDDIYGKGVELVSAQVLDKHHGSDHYPVHSVLRVKKNKTAYGLTD